MARARAVRGDYLVIEEGKYPITISGSENGRNVMYYFTTDEIADEILPRTTQEALAVIGAWSDLDWDEMSEALDRIRHESEPTPPIENLDER